MNRRDLLATISAAGAAIGGASTVAGQQGGRATTAESGLVVQFEDCRTIHVRGNSRQPIRIFPHALFLRNGETLVGGYGFIMEPDLPITITTDVIRERHSGTLDPIVFHSVHIYSLGEPRDLLLSARVPEEWDCRQIVYDAANDDGGS